MCTTTIKYHKIENIKSIEAILKETTVTNLKEREWEKVKENITDVFMNQTMELIFIPRVNKGKR